MSEIVDLLAWKRSHLAPAPRVTQVGGVGPDHHVEQAADGADPEMRRLESAVRRLDALTSRTIRRRGRLSAQIETELLAILGELSMGLLDAACERSERLVARLRDGARHAGSQA
jgi:hypothetical protein